MMVMRHRLRPVLESFETRELLSGLMIALQSHPSRPHLGAQTLAREAANPTINPLYQQGDPTKNQFLFPTGQPTPHEVRREKFVFKFTGPFVQGPGRFSDEKSSVLIRGVGSSTFFLHGDLQLGAVVPTDPTRSTSGQAESYDRNNNTNSAFGFDLTGDPTAVDSAGRPTRFSGVTDFNTSSGLFAEAPGQVTVTIKYHPGGPSEPRATSHGTADVIIRGATNTIGTLNNLAVLGHWNTNNSNKIGL